MTTATSGKRASLMQKLKKANASGTGNNFRDGKYRAVVKSMGFKEGFKGTRYQVEFVVMNAQKVPVVSVKTGQPLDITPNPVGSTVDWLCVRLDDLEQPGAGNLKRFILDLVGASDATEDDYFETLQELSDVDENGDALPAEQRQEPGKGMCVDIETVRKETVKNKKEIVTLRFSHVPDSQYDQNAMISWMDQIAMFNAQQQQAALPAATAATA
jgi:hypothetical protein